MKTKGPEFILLVDDDEATNFIHRLIIKSVLPDTRFLSARTGREALGILTQISSDPSAEQSGPKGIIFLDINMPAMNGWEFLREFRALPIVNDNGVVIIMLSTSMNPDDEERAKKSTTVDHFVTKPLTTLSFKEIIDTHF